MSTGRILSICIVTAVLAALPASPQRVGDVQGQEDVKLPNGKSQRDEILKAEHKKSLSDVAQILEIAGQLQAELEKDDYSVLSVSSLKKAEQIENLAKRVRKRLKR